MALLSRLRRSGSETSIVAAADREEITRAR
jgi:hypothetical protein